MRSTNPSSAGVSQKLNEIFDPLLEEKKLTHFHVAWGSLNRQDDFNQLMNPVGNFFFDLASLTKALCTLPLILQYVSPSFELLDKNLGTLLSSEEGRVFPPSVLQHSLRSILRHRSGFVAWQNFWMNKLDPQFKEKTFDRFQRRSSVFERLYDPGAEQGAKCLYSDVGYLVLGIFLESVYKKDLSKLFPQFCKDALNLKTPELLFPNGNTQIPLVPTSYCPIRERQLVGEVHDENAASLGGVCGHSGLFASGAGLVDFLRAFFESSLGKQLLLENRTLVGSCEPGEYLLGWQCDRFSFAPNEPVWKHLGFTGTGVWIFPQRNTFLCILTNRIISSRTSSWIQGLRHEVCEVLWKEWNL